MRPFCDGTVTSMSSIALPQLPELRGIAVRQDRAGPARHNRGKPAPLDPEPVMAIGVNTAVKANEPSRPNPLRNAAIPKPWLRQSQGWSRTERLSQGKSPNPMR